jgi:hypothetical protein
LTDDATISVIAETARKLVSRMPCLRHCQVRNFKTRHRPQLLMSFVFGSHHKPAVRMLSLVRPGVIDV